MLQPAFEFLNNMQDNWDGGKWYPVWIHWEYPGSLSRLSGTAFFLNRSNVSISQRALIQEAMYAHAEKEKEEKKEVGFVFSDILWDLVWFQEIQQQLAGDDIGYEIPKADSVRELMLHAGTEA